MKNRMSNASQQFVEFLTRVACWLWETIEKLLDIILDFLARIIELILAVLNLIFQVICFLRDLWFEAMQTFANVFRGIVNVVSSITCEEVEDFASACIVILLWFGLFKLIKNLYQNSRVAAYLYPEDPDINNNKLERFDLEDCLPCGQKRTGRRVNRRNEKRSRTNPEKDEFDD